MGMALILFMLVTALLWGLSKWSLNYYIKDRLIKVLKQGAVTLLMFNIFNFAYSTQINFKFA